VADDFSDDIATTGAVPIGGTAAGNIEVTGDRDWFRVTLTAGVQYALEVRFGGANGTLFFPDMQLMSATGALITVGNSGTLGVVRVIYTPTVSGDFFLNVGQGFPGGGTYTMAAISNYQLFSEGDDNVSLAAVGAASGGTWHALGGNDFVTGTTGADTIFGDAGNDSLIANRRGFTANDTLYGGTGNDGLVAGDGTQLLDGGADTDTVMYHFYNEFTDASVSIILDDNGNGTATGHGTHTLVSIENILGTDSLTGDFIVTGAGANRIEGYYGSDYIDSGAGNDIIYGDFTDGAPEAGGNDSIIAGSGNDTVYGDGNDFGNAAAGANNDVILLDDYRNPLTSIGNDTAYGQQGNDLLWGYGGNDMLYGGTGDDALVGNDFIAAVSGIDTMFGGDGNDRLFVGIAGSAAMDGGAGNDSLYGGAGADTLIDGMGNDFMYGAGGADMFFFNNYFFAHATAETDIIYFFNAAEGDKLQLYPQMPGYGTLTFVDAVYNLPGLGNVNSVYMYNGDGMWSAVIYGVDVATLQANIVYL
jgi:Ca2+-binding RTX toxin-like protein